MRVATSRILTSLVLLACGACDLKCSGSGSGGTPDRVVYEPDTTEAWVSAAFASPLPDANFQVVDYALTSSSPALPDGLVLDSDTGQIFGTPQGAQAPVEYRVEALRADGRTFSASITIEIHSAVAPSALSYSPNPIIGTQGEGVLDSTPSLTGIAEFFSVDPALPTGLDFDTDTGVISGFLGGALGTTQHTITAHNPLGQAQTTLDVTALVALEVEGLLVTSFQDRTVDSFAPDEQVLTARDFVAFGAAGVSAVAPTASGEILYVATDDGLLHLVRRDPLTGEMGAPSSLGNAGAVRRLIVTSGDRYLIAARDGAVLRYEIQPGGSLLSSGQALGPTNGASAISLGSNDAFLAVGASSPGALWIYDVAPTFQLRAAQLTLGAQVEFSDMIALGSTIYAATSTFNLSNSTYQGRLRRFTVSTPAQVANGAAAAVQNQNIVLGNHLTSITRLTAAFLGDIAVTDSGLGRIYTARLSAAVIETPFSTFLSPGSPLDCVELTSSAGTNLYVLDSNAAEIRVHSGFNALTLLSRVKTRGFPNELIAVRGQGARSVTDAVFVPGEQASDLRTLAFTNLSGFAAAAQGPVATTDGARDAIAHPFLPVVYTAERDGASIGVFAYDDQSEQLTLVENESLSPGALPVALAFGLGGNVLFAADESGNVARATVDATTGELTLTGATPIPNSMLGARLATDPIGRFAFVAQPNAGQIVSLRLSATNVAPTVSAFSSAIAEPVDLAVSADGRFVYVLDRSSARIALFAIDTADGGLISSSGGFGFGTAPTRLAIADWLGVPRMFAIDPTLDTCFVMVRNISTGALTAATQASFAVASGVTSVAVLDGAVEAGPLFTHQNIGGATFESYRVGLQAAISPSSVDTVGQGPSAIAVRRVFVAD